jgi:hypothetical protein
VYSSGDVFSFALESVTTFIMADGCKLFVYGVDQNMANEEIKVQFFISIMRLFAFDTGSLI